MTQKQLDILKWLDSEKNNKDMCGLYDFCIYCDKNKKNPCIFAKNMYNKINLRRATS